MRTENLASPGYYSNGQQLRAMAARAISFLEINPGSTGNATTLKAFFDSCSAAVVAAVGAAPTAANQTGVQGASTTKTFPLTFTGITSAVTAVVKTSGNGTWALGTDGKSVVHVSGAAGSDVATVTVTDGVGRTVTFTLTVTVS